MEDYAIGGETMEIDKVIITNRGALREKYGKTMPRIEGALLRLVAADKKRGLETKVVAVDAAADMKAAGGRPTGRTTS
jgi:hypothetical protein